MCSLPEWSKVYEKMHNNEKAYCRGSRCSATGAKASAVAWPCELLYLNTDSILGYDFACAALHCTE